VPADVRVKAGNDQAAQLSFYYIFIKVKNTGPKKIISVAYDFIFTDAGTREELKRYLRRGFETIGTNETKWVKSINQGPPQAHPEIKDDLCERMRSNFKLKRSTGRGPIIY